MMLKTRVAVSTDDLGVDLEQPTSDAAFQTRTSDR